MITTTMGALLAAAGPTRDICVETNPYRGPVQRYEAWDRKSFDYEPGSRFHCIGRGATKQEAINELLADLAEAEMASARDNHTMRVGRTQEDPGELVPVRGQDPDSDL